MPGPAKRVGGAWQRTGEEEPSKEREKQGNVMCVCLGKKEGEGKKGPSSFKKKGLFPLFLFFCSLVCSWHYLSPSSQLATLNPSLDKSYVIFLSNFVNLLFVI